MLPYTCVGRIGSRAEEAGASRFAKMAETNSAPAKEPRQRVTKRFFIGDDGKPSARALPDTQALRIEWQENGHVTNFDMTALSDEVTCAAAAFGVMTSATNAAGGAEDVDEAIDRCEDRLKTLLAGAWAAERETGPRVGDLVEAIARYQKSKGKTLADGWQERMAEQFSAKQLDAKAYEKDPAVRVHLLAIKKERADERYAKAAQAAEEATTASIADDLA